MKVESIDRAKRIDVVPMHVQLTASLRRRFETNPATPKARLFGETVIDRTRLKEFQ